MVSGLRFGLCEMIVSRIRPLLLIDAVFRVYFLIALHYVPLYSPTEYASYAWCAIYFLLDH